jgi:hypothetical protein
MSSACRKTLFRPTGSTGRSVRLIGSWISGLNSGVSKPIEGKLRLPVPNVVMMLSYSSLVWILFIPEKKTNEDVECSEKNN